MDIVQTCCVVTVNGEVLFAFRRSLRKLTASAAERMMEIAAKVILR